MPYANVPQGILRADDSGLEVLDTLAGRVSVVGYNTDTIKSAIKKRLDEDLGDAFRPQGGNTPNEIVDLISQCNTSSTGAVFDAATVFSSPDLAHEAILTASRIRDQGARYRTIALVGNDHGRTGMCRTASGLAGLRTGFGPMMAGFDHVQPGDLDALEAAINEQTGAVLIRPISLLEAARPLDRDYVQGVRMLCDEHDLWLIVDESPLVFGSAGEALSTSTIADISVDAAILAAGLMAGLPGAVLLTSASATPHLAPSFPSCPLETVAIEATLYEFLDQELGTTAAEKTHAIAVALAERVAGFEFVRDVIPVGTSIGIETDLNSQVLADHCLHFGVCVETAGETAIRMSLPIKMDPEDLEMLLDRLSEVFEASEKYQPIPT